LFNCSDFKEAITAPGNRGNMKLLSDNQPIVARDVMTRFDKSITSVAKKENI